MKKTIILRIVDDWESYDALKECPLDLKTFVQNIRAFEDGIFKIDAGKRLGERMFTGSLIEIEGDLPEKSFDKLYGYLMEDPKGSTHFYWVEVIDA